MVTCSYKENPKESTRKILELINSAKLKEWKIKFYFYMLARNIQKIRKQFHLQEHPKG